MSTDVQSGPGATSDARTAELGERLSAVRERIAAACALAGRQDDEVTLVVVTKYFPAQDVARLVRLGVRDVGENRDQEASAKAAEWIEHLTEGERHLAEGLRWHFVGQLQSRKAGSVASYAHLVHSVDRPKLVGALDRAADRHGRRLGVCVQVDLQEVAGSGGPEASTGRGGARPQEVAGLCEQVAASAHLELRGLMTVAPPTADPSGAFAALADLHGKVLDDHPGATMLSAGMSGDLEAAVAAGATHVRVGSAILGPRPALG